MMFELDQIFAQPLTTTAFLYASAAMLGVFAAVALHMRSPRSFGFAEPGQAAVNAR